MLFSSANCFSFPLSKRFVLKILALNIYYFRKSITHREHHRPLEKPKSYYQIFQKVCIEWQNHDVTENAFEQRLNTRFSGFANINKALFVPAQKSHHRQYCCSHQNFALRKFKCFAWWLMVHNEMIEVEIDMKLYNCLKIIFFN